MQRFLEFKSLQRVEVSNHEKQSRERNEERTKIATRAAAFSACQGLKIINRDRAGRGKMLSDISLRF